MANFSLAATAHHYPDLPYEQMKDDVLGKSYQAELTFVGATRARELNRRYRSKLYVPNVLSFPLADTHGEVYICPQKAKREAHQYEMTYEGFVGFLFIHALLHLKGYDHGATMTRSEERYKKKYRLS